MNVRNYIFAAILFAPPSLACVEIPVAPLSATNFELLVEELERNFPQGDVEASIRNVASYGYEKPRHARIELQPHRHEAGADYHHVVDCKYSNESVWNCGKPEEKREISFDTPTDHVRIAEDVDAKVAKRIVNSIRNALFVDQSGRYTYSRYGESEISAEPLDLVYIWIDHDGSYSASASATGICAAHRIVVREIPCGLIDCAFDVVENEVLHRP